jgi:hypothetical protein
MPASLADADPLAFILKRIRTDPAVLALLGDGGVGASNMPPYPRVVLTDPPGGDFHGEARWLIATAIRIDVLGDIDGRPGRAALKALMYAVIESIREIPYEQSQPGDPVITDVVFAPAGFSPIGAGQPRYVLTATLYSHPPA